MVEVSPSKGAGHSMLCPYNTGGGKYFSSHSWYDVAMHDKFVVGLIQMRSTKDAAENLARAVEKIREAAKRGAQIVCMDELFRNEYFCRTENAELFNLAETFPGPTTDVLTKVALENK